jgi:predicted dehydrogenase
MKKLNIALVGLGAIGRSHAERLNTSNRACLSAIVDVSEPSKTYANELGIPHFENLETLFKNHIPDGVILATPNHLHVEGALMCARNSVSALIEKPVADTVKNGQKLLRGLAKWRIPMLVGHHRRHSAALQAAKKHIDEGRLGKLVSVVGSAQFYKPDSYFDAIWRTKKGGGPILINLIHEMDNLRFLCGNIVQVQAMASNVIRNFEVEDTVVINFKFENGMLGTFTLSDTAVMPLSWEQTSGENKAYDNPENHGNTDCYFIAGTEGGMAVPSLRTWFYEGEKSWFSAFSKVTLEIDEIDPLVAQLNHFCDVIEGKAKPIVSAADALESLKVVEMVQKGIMKKQKK